MLESLDTPPRLIQSRKGPGKPGKDNPKTKEKLNDPENFQNVQNQGKKYRDDLKDAVKDKPADSG